MFTPDGVCFSSVDFNILQNEKKARVNITDGNDVKCFSTFQMRNIC